MGLACEFLVHNRYQQKGGEDVVFDTERALLEKAGHEVSVYERDNHEIKNYSSLRLLDLSRRTIWATDSVAALRGILSRHRPEVAYFFNTFPLISPAHTRFAHRLGSPSFKTSQTTVSSAPEETSLETERTANSASRRRLRGLGFDTVATEVPFPVLPWWPPCSHSTPLQVPGASRSLSYIALTEFARKKYIAGGIPGGQEDRQTQLYQP